jgi:hypothetical protein
MKVCSGWNTSLIIEMIIWLTTAKFKSLIFSMLGFSLPNIATCIFSWCWMTLACYLHNLVIKWYTYGIWKYMCISRIVVFLGNLPMVWRILFCRRWSFIRCVSAAKSHAKEAYVIMDLIRALCRVNLLLVLNRSLLNKEYNLMNVL